MLPPGVAGFERRWVLPARAFQIYSRQIQQGLIAKAVGVALAELGDLDDAQGEQFARRIRITVGGKGAPLSCTAFHAWSNASTKIRTSLSSKAPSSACFAKSWSMTSPGTTLHVRIWTGQIMARFRLSTGVHREGNKRLYVHTPPE